MSFVSFYPRLDKICDASYVKTILGTTKKDAITIIQQINLSTTFEEAEKELSDVVNSIRHKLEEKLRTQAVKEAIFAYKQRLLAKNKIDKKEREHLEKQQIIEEYKKQMKARYSLTSVSNGESDDEDSDDKPIQSNDGPTMTLPQFLVLIQSAIQDDAICFKVKPSDVARKPTAKIVNNQLQVTISCKFPSTVDVPSKILLNTNVGTSSSS